MPACLGESIAAWSRPLVLHRFLEISALCVACLAVVVFHSSCGVGGMLSGAQSWRGDRGGEVAARSRRWPSAIPVVEGAFDVELYKLRLGSEVLSFRNTRSVEKSFTNLLTALRSEGWQILDHHGTGWERAISGCGPDCETQRFYATVEASRRGEVVTTIRASVPGEFGRRVVPTGRCRPLKLAMDRENAAAARYGSVFSADLDRDGRLDGFVPRVEGKDEQGEAIVVWDAVIVRNDCAHVVGSFPGVPADSAFSPMGQRGLIDLLVSSRVTVEGHRQRITELYRYDGAHYVSVERR